MLTTGPARADGGADLDRGEDGASATRGRLAMVVDVGVPDGLMAALVLRASERIELQLGAGHNTIAAGVRAGVALSAATGGSSPYLALDAGIYGRGQAGEWLRGVAESAGAGDAMLEDFGYRFASAHLGLRLGGSEAAVRLQAGVSWIDGSLGLREVRSGDMEPTVEVYTRTGVSAFSPSGRIGLQLYF